MNYVVASFKIFGRKVVLTPFQKSLFLNIFLLALCLFAYSNSLQNRFMLDDRGLIKDAAQYKFILANASDIHFRPVAYFIFSILFFLFRDNPFGYHLAGILFFYLNCLLMFKLGTVFLKDKRISFGAAALFSVHPINVMVVSYMTASVISLYALFMQLSILAFLKSLDKNRKAFIALSLVCFILAFLCHEVAILLPAYLFLILIFLQKYDCKKCFQKIWGFGALAMGYVFFRMFFASLNKSVLEKILSLGGSWLDYPATFLQLIGWYIKKLFYPMDITWIYSLPLTQEGSFFVILRFFVLMGLIVYLVKRFFKDPRLIFALIFFLLGFVPAIFSSSTMLFLGLIIEPHWFYFSSMGFFMFAAFVFLNAKDASIARFKFIIFCFLLIVLGFTTRSYNSLWKDEKSYSLDWLRISPGNPSAYFYLATAYFEEEDYVRSKEYFQKSLIHNRRDAQVYTSLGLIDLRLDNFDSAIQNFNRALKINPRSAVAHNNMGLTFLRKGDVEMAKQAFANALEVDPTLLEPRLNLAVFYSQQGQKEKAVFLCLENLRFSPFDDRSLALLAKLYFQLNRTEDAVRVGQAMVKKGFNTQSLLDSGNLFAKNKSYEIALNLFLRARDKNSRNKDVYFELGKFYAFRGQLHSAISVWKEGLRISAQDPRFEENIKRARELLGMD